METVTPRTTRRAKAIINGLIANKQLTEKGSNFLTLSTDPFHDIPLEPAGFPDINTVPSIVQNFTYTSNIAAPTYTGTGPWEAHIFFSPFTPPSNNPALGLGLIAFPFLPFSGVVSPVATAGVPPILPGYNVLTGPPGTDWTTNPNWVNNSQNVYLPWSTFGGLYRLIAVGVEVVNTTAVLYKSGAATCYRTPSHRQHMTIQHQITSGSPNTFETCPVETIEMPPTSQALAQLYPTSRTWAAEEGYYGIGTLTDPANDYLGPFPKIICATNPSSNSILTANTSQLAWFWPTAIITIGVVPPQAGLCPAQVLPFDTHGVVFTGLNSQSTLQVTTRYIVERIPSTLEPTLLVLTRPPTPYDPIALEIYSRTIAALPVGCMVKENPLGEWFTGILEAVASVAPLVGTLFGPVGTTVGTLVGTGAGAAARAIKPAPEPSGTVLGQNPKKRRPRPRRKQTVSLGPTELARARMPIRTTQVTTTRKRT